MTIKRVAVGEVKIGMYIDRIDTSWFKHPFITNSLTISSEKDLSQLTKSGVSYVYIDTDKGLYNFDRNEQGYGRAFVRKWKLEGISQAESRRLEDKVPLQEELKISRKIYRKTKKVIEKVYKRAGKGKSLNWNEIFKSIDSMTSSVLRNKDAFMNLSMIKNYDNYTFYHSMNVCSLCLTMGRYIGFGKEDLTALGVGALLHDIGKVNIPEKIINKPGRLTEAEFAIIKRHPEYSREILSKDSHIRWDSINLAYEHHERFDGNGYPGNLRGFRINQFALIAAIADVFDAITSDRSYRKAMPLDVAMKKMFEWGKKDFAPSYLLKFVQCMGVYPVSTIVELDNREIGIVSEINHLNLEKPKLIGIFDSHYRRLKQPKVIDLASEEYSNNYVIRCLDASKIGVDINKFLEDGKI